MKVEYAKVSALGDRKDNQDRGSIVLSDEAALMMVFDGMGGHSDGAIAAQTGLKVVQDIFTASRMPVFDPQGFLYMALSRAHDEVVNLGHELAVDFRPRATCALCLVQESGAFWAHIGDSRIYQVRGDEVLLRSRDHSHVEILIQEGAITEEEARDLLEKKFIGPLEDFKSRFNRPFEAALELKQEESKTGKNFFCHIATYLYYSYNLCSRNSCSFCLSQ